MSNEKFVRVAALKDIGENAPFCASAGGVAVAIFKVQGKIYAIANTCSHAGGPLCEGEAKDSVVTCPWHGSKFNVQTGAVVNGPATTAVKSYPVEIRNDDVFVGV